MDTRLLKTFLLAAEYENFREVAEKLFITQPAVTFQIRQLEKELGDKLFSKDGRNIVLTEFGRLFYQEAKEIISQYTKSIQRMNQFKQGYHRLLRIAISPLLADTILPTILYRYRNDHPEVEFTIRVMESSLISEQIENGAVDIGLSCLPGSSLVNSVAFHEEEVSLVMKHDGYDSESGPVLDALEILETNIVFTDNHPVYWNMLKNQLQTRIPHLQTMVVNQSHITKRFVLEGIGVSFLPKSIINREILEGRLLEVPVGFMELPTASMYLVCKNQNNYDDEFARFINNFHYS
ncbi:LysR family transcriptional regulator [Ornithinibacillus contaminans]|uniref:LysR family transcriptional regulator n=1 Tax=Ornithinibacillus contaminans TaxID=694055 RepID=UPI00064DF5B0|nr:LysR family transcriptional regulator [Ornithinibacillus contaminans]